MLHNEYDEIFYFKIFHFKNLKHFKMHSNFIYIYIYFLRYPINSEFYLFIDKAR